MSQDSGRERIPAGLWGEIKELLVSFVLLSFLWSRN